jgi:drug/metabolite transporter (DMT)-like permease
LIAWAISGIINVSANFLMILGMERGQISDTVPFLSLSPIFLLASGYVLLGESMSAIGIMGVVTVALGGLWLSRASAETSKAEVGSDVVVKPSFVSLPPGACIYIFIAFIQSVSSAFDKRGVRAAAAPMLYGGTISLTVSISALLKYLASRETREAQYPMNDTEGNAGLFVGPVNDLGLAHGLGNLMYEEETLSRTDGLDDIKAQPRMRRKVSKAFDVLPSLCLTLVACALKMVAYWCQLQANEFVYSAQLSAVRKSGMLLVLLLGRFLFNEDVASKWLPVSTMLVGVGLLAAI